MPGVSRHHGLAVNVGCALKGILAAAVLVRVVLWVLDPVLDPFSLRVREERPRTSNGQSLMDIAKGIDQYHLDEGRYPPAWTEDDEGTRLHSWRALILPHTELFRWVDYDLEQPWHSEHNQTREFYTAAGVENYVGPTLYCDASDRWIGWKDTTVFALVTPESVWVNATAEVPAVDTLLVVQGEEAVHWTTPCDVELLGDAAARPPGLPKIRPRLKGLGIFTDSNSETKHKITIRPYEVKSIEELMKLANPNRKAPPNDDREPSPDIEK